MEIANLSGSKTTRGGVRPAKEEDARAIMRLLKTARYRHVHLDWHLPVDWLGTPGFVVKQDQTQSPSASPSLVTKLLGPSLGLQGCLAVACDPPPAAWVRVASVSDRGDPQESLESMLSAVIGYLRNTEATVLGWLLANGWPEAWLPPLGFQKSNEIETYLKEDLELPQVSPVPGLRFRQAELSDMEELAQMEAAAFKPLWRHSANSLALALYQAISFEVAILEGQVIGFQVSTQSDFTAHLVRLTINPEKQGLGIGSALLVHAIRDYQARGLRQISLNTQVDNLASQHLYRKFGFHASGQRLPIWTRPL